ncbi:hypothetical protein [Halorubrum tibetense]|uniref:DUF1102 domain-containing protein n=1 Tax=Halorubrum tibetense TaxID=175631 RepID=A0ABD5SAB1_9EURY
MKRRQFALGLGAVTTAGTAIIGSGAFTSVEAERAVTVEVADDSDAFLALNPTTEYARIRDDGTFTLDLTPSNPTEAGGTGVNANADTIIRDAFEIKNQGTQSIQVLFNGGTNGGPKARIRLADVGDDLTVNISPSVETTDQTPSPGEAIPYDVEVFAGEGATPNSEIDETVTVVAEAIE